jgi:hypothetical protein
MKYMLTCVTVFSEEVTKRSKEEVVRKEKEQASKRWVLTPRAPHLLQCCPWQTEVVQCRLSCTVQ